MHCPICKLTKLLLIDDLSGHVEGRCNQCSGRWLGFSEAVRLGFVMDSEKNTSSLSVANCPRCLEKSLVYTAAALPVSIRPLRCLQCDGVWVSQDIVLKVKDKTIKSAPIVINASHADISLDAVFDQARSDALSNKKAFHDSPITEFLAVPIAAIVVWLLYQMQLGRFLQDVLFGMPLHELGHAIALWLTGVVAIPIPFLTLPMSSRGIFGFLLSIAVILFAAWKGRQHGLIFWLIVSAMGVYFMLAKGIFSDEAEREMWVSYSGIGGEFILGTLFVMAFFYPMHRNPSWILMRYAVLFLGMSVLLPSWLEWRDIAAGNQPFPLGSLVFGKEEGDMNRLLSLGMTVETVTESYLQLGRWCFIVIGLHVAVSAVKAYKFFQKTRELQR